MSSELIAQGPVECRVSSVWTQFFDMSSGGSEKLGACKIWIEAPEREATELFEQMFDRDPHNVTCSCCGSDYSISEYEKADIGDGDWVVTAADIARFKGGHMLTANAEITGSPKASPG